MGSGGISRDPNIVGRAIVAPWLFRRDPASGVTGLCSGDESAQQVADRLGVSRPTLYSWKDQLLGHEAPSSMKRRKANSKVPEREELERQLEALQRDVRQLQLEHDLLKKANELLKNVWPARLQEDFTVF